MDGSFTTESGGGLNEFALDFTSDNPNGDWSLVIDDDDANGARGTLIN